MVPEARVEFPPTRIRPSRGWIPLNIGELWSYRELVYFLTWRDIKIRYKQTVLGATWAILQPLLAMVIFTVFFGRLAGLPSDGIPYPLFSYSGMVIWLFFANGVTFSSNSMIEAANTIKKVYFPRMAIPLGAIFAGAVDFFLACIVLLGMMAYYGVWPGWNVFWLPPLLLLALITTLGVGLWFSAMNVLFRDVRYAVPFIVQAWLFLTPVAYSSNMMSGSWKVVYGLNPMAGVVDGFRWALLGVDSRPGPMIVVSALVSVVVFVSGAYFFRRTERSFADVV